MVWKLHYYPVIIFYLPYKDHLIENNIWIDKIRTYIQLKSCSLFWVQSEFIKWIFSIEIWRNENHLYWKFSYFYCNFQPYWVFPVAANCQAEIFFAQNMKICIEFGYKCFSRHQLQGENKLILQILKKLRIKKNF